VNEPLLKLLYVSIDSPKESKIFNDTDAVFKLITEIYQSSYENLLFIENSEGRFKPFDVFDYFTEWCRVGFIPIEEFLSNVIHRDFGIKFEMI
jgi:hypothetical protein